MLRASYRLDFKFYSSHWKYMYFKLPRMQEPLKAEDLWIWAIWTKEKEVESEDYEDMVDK